MKQEINRILNKYGIIEPGAVKELEEWFISCINASKEVGRRTMHMPITLEMEAWKDIYRAGIEKKESKGSAFAQKNCDELQHKFRIVLRYPK